MSYIAGALLFIAVLAIFLVWRLGRSLSSPSSGARNAEDVDILVAWPPQATDVLTVAERQAYDVLREALPAHMILAQVPLKRFVKVPTRNSYAEWLRRVGNQSVDFLVCDRRARVVAAVELRLSDEKPSEKARRRQERLLNVLKASRIPVHVWSAGSLPSPDAAREAITPFEFRTVGQTRRIPERRPSAVSVQFLDSAMSPNEITSTFEPPPSTWFDDLDTRAPSLGAASTNE